MHHDNGDHFAAAHWMLTGYHGSNAANLAPQYPSAASIITKAQGGEAVRGCLAYVGLPNTHSVGLRPGYHGAAYLGVAYNPFSADGDPNNPTITRSRTLICLPAWTSTALRRPSELALRRSTTPALTLIASGLMEGLDRFTQDAYAMVTGPAARAAFDLSTESPHLRDRYGRHQWGQSALLARRMVEAGVRFVTLTYGGWDHHSNIEAGMKRHTADHRQRDCQPR